MLQAATLGVAFTILDSATGATGQEKGVRVRGSPVKQGEPPPTTLWPCWGEANRYKIRNYHKSQGSYEEDRSQIVRLGISHGEYKNKRESLYRFRAFPPASPQPSAPGPAPATPWRQCWGKGPISQTLGLSWATSQGSAPALRVPHARTPPPSALHNRSSPTHRLYRPPLLRALKRPSRKRRGQGRKSRAAPGRGQRRGGASGGEGAEPPGRV